MTKQYNRREFAAFVIGASPLIRLDKNLLPRTEVASIHIVSDLDAIAESYVKLALQVSKYDPNYLDAYIGPAEWKQADKIPLPQLNLSTVQLVEQLAKLRQTNNDLLEYQRLTFLSMQLAAVKAKIDILHGKKMSFEEEFNALYGTKGATLARSDFQALIGQVDQLLPGQGGLVERVARLKSAFVIPANKIDLIVSLANAEARSRTLQQIDLPPGENVRMEFLKDIPYSSACWYLGNPHSLYQINSSMSMELFWILSDACHEAYPGHHTYFTLLDTLFRQENKWPEFSIIPLYSPIEVISEGMAIYTLDLVFPLEERVAFGKKLADLAGLDSSNMALYFGIFSILLKLRFMAYGEVAGQLADGKVTKAQAVKLYKELALVDEKEADLQVHSCDVYKSYKRCFYTGWQMVENYIKVGTAKQNTAAKRWELFRELLTRLPTATLFQ